jgi:glycosyltransferase involved in cell wall biosynthesis
MGADCFVSANPQLHQFLVSREFGGGSEIALQLADQWRKRESSQPQVWVPGEGRAAAMVRSLDLPMRWYDGKGIFSRLRLRAGTANLVTGMRLRAMGGGIVHIHSPHHYAALRHGFRLGRVKRVVHIHLDFGVESLRWTLEEPPELIVTCAKFLTQSVREALPAAYRERTRIVSVPNAVDLQKFAPGDKAAAKAKLGAPLDRPLLLMMANLAPHKGQETAIRAVRLLQDRGREVQLWLAGADRSGNGQFEEKLKSLIAEMGLEHRVTLLGFRQDGPELLTAADVVLLPSTSEGLPLTLLEAQASGTPVIAAPTAGIPEIVEDGHSGFLVAAHDSQGYAARIEQLLAAPDLVQQVTSAALDRCRRLHSWKAYHARMAELYSEVLAG